MFERKDYLDLSGKTAVVTGAGSGIGLAVADMLSAYGAAVAIVDVNPAGEEEARKFREAGMPEALQAANGERTRNCG